MADKKKGDNKKQEFQTKTRTSNDQLGENKAESTMNTTTKCTEKK